MKIISLSSFILALLLVGNDIEQRFFSFDSEPTVKTKINTGILNEPLPQLNKQRQLLLQQAFAKYNIEQKKEVELSGLSLDEQKKQHGELLEVFSGDWLYKLVAIITPENGNQTLSRPLALVKAMNVKTNEVNIEEIQHGDDLADYKVSIINNKQINLQFKQQKIELLMYQSREK